MYVKCGLERNLEVSERGQDSSQQSERCCTVSMSCPPRAVGFVSHISSQFEIHIEHLLGDESDHALSLSPVVFHQAQRATLIVMA